MKGCKTSNGVSIRGFFGHASSLFVIVCMAQRRLLYQEENGADSYS